MLFLNQCFSILTVNTSKVRKLSSLAGGWGWGCWLNSTEDIFEAVKQVENEDSMEHNNVGMNVRC